MRNRHPRFSFTCRRIFPRTEIPLIIPALNTDFSGLGLEFHPGKCYNLHISMLFDH